MVSKIESDLIPFSSIVGPIARFIQRPFSRQKRPDEEAPDLAGEDGGVQRKWAHAGEPEVDALTHQKHRPRVAGGGENLPLEVIRCLSEWMSVLEARGTVPGTSLGAMIGTLAAFEDTLSGKQCIDSLMGYRYCLCQVLKGF
jgi:ion channel-forming bestrophin family protein